MTTTHTQAGVVLVGVGVIIVRDGNVLLGERAGAHGAGTWALPGGHLEFGETVADCARREVLEETGLAVHDIAPAPYTSDVFVAEGRHYITLFVTAQARGEPAVLEPAKCLGWQWCRWSDLPRPLFLPLQTLFDSGFVPAGVAQNVVIAMDNAGPRLAGRARRAPPHSGMIRASSPECTVMPAHEKLDYVEFPARDLAATKQFFAQAFGWTFEDYGPDYIAFSREGLDGGFYRADLQARSEAGSALLVFYSARIEDTLAKVEAAGGTILKPVFEFPGGRRFHFAEPSGNEFAVWSDPVG